MQYFLDQIENKRHSKKIFWAILVIIKDVLWKTEQFILQIRFRFYYYLSVLTEHMEFEKHNYFSGYNSNNKKDGMSIVIPVCNQLESTKNTIRSIIDNTHDVPYEIIIIDNGSKPDVRNYFDLIAKQIKIQYIRNEQNAGVIKALNQGVNAANYRYVMVMHNDVLIREENWLGKIIKLMEKDPKIGIVGLAGWRIIGKYCGISAQHDNLRGLHAANRLLLARGDEIEVAVVDGLCFVMREELIKKIDGFDEIYGPMHLYDKDISLQSINAGFKNYLLYIEADHLSEKTVGITRRSDDYKALVKNDDKLLMRNKILFVKKWRRLLPIKICS